MVIAITLVVYQFSSQKRKVINSNGETTIETKNYFTGNVQVQIKDTMGVLLQKYKRVDGKISGEHYTYYANGSEKTKTKYRNGVKNGSHKEYFPSKNIKNEFNYRDGKKHGRCKTFSESGTLMLDNYYFDGELNLLQSFYDTVTSRYIRPVLVTKLDTIPRHPPSELSICIHNEVIDVIGENLYLFYDYVTVDVWESGKFDSPKDSIKIEKECIHFDLHITHPGNYKLFYFIDKPPLYLGNEGFDFRVFNTEIEVI